MTRIFRALQRALTLAAMTTAAVTFGLFAGTAPASAHVHVDADGAAPGKGAIVTFRVPNESENGSLTTQLMVNLPQGSASMAEAIPGWSVKLDRDVGSGTVRSVTWTAAPGSGIAPDQFGLFRISLTLPKSDSVSFPAVQTYSDGTVVRWDQPPLPNGDEPEHPAPTLTLTSPQAPTPLVHPDNTARWLAIAALVVGVLAAAVALVRRRP